MTTLLLVAEGARFAGIEAHLLTFLRAVQRRGVKPHVAVFNRGPLAERLTHRDIPVHEIKRRGKYDRDAINQLGNLVHAIAADLVHTHGYLANVIAAAALADSEIPLVTTVHGSPEPFGLVAGLKMRMNLYLDRRAMRRRDNRVIAVSDKLAAELAAKGVPRGKLAVVRNGVEPVGLDPLQRHESRRELELAPDAIAFAFVGRMEPVKDPLAFVDFAALVNDARLNCAFLVAGDGPLLEPMRRRVLELGLLPRFRFLGFIDDLVPFFAAADCLVITSRHEGIPLAALEAMRAGVPIVAPSVGGLPELLQDLEGVLAPSRNVRQLAALALRLAADGKRRAALGDQLRERYLTEYTTDVMTDRIFAVYRDAGAKIP